MRATTREMNASKRLEELERWVAAAADRLEIQGVGVTRPYPPEWDSEPYPKGFKVPALHSFDGTKLASQHVYHFKSLTSSVSGNEAVMTRLLLASFRGLLLNSSNVSSPKVSSLGATSNENSQITSLTAIWKFPPLLPLQDRGKENQ